MEDKKFFEELKSSLKEGTKALKEGKPLVSRVVEQDEEVEKTNG
jgi:hypothetical protein